MPQAQALHIWIAACLTKYLLYRVPEHRGIDAFNEENIIPDEVVKIVDIKLGGSGEKESFLYDNFNQIEKKDEIKFVLSDFFDYNEMKDIIKKNRLEEDRSILVSRVFGSEITDEQIAEKLLEDRLNVRYQIQLHKLIWGNKKGK